MVIFVALISALIFFIYYVIVKPFDYWKNRGINCEKPQFLIGNWGPVLSYKCCQPEFFKQFYDKYPNQRCIPLYQFLTPALIVKDPELIKQIAIKDFDSIPDHIVYVSKKDDPLWSKNLFAMPGGQEWRDIRSTLSPAFTKSKLKIMYNLMVDCAQSLTKHFDKNTLMIFEAKDTFSKVTNDIIATTAFGVQCDSMKNEDNQLFTMGKELLYFDGFLQNLKFLIFYINPFLAKLLKIRLVKKKPGQFFRKLLNDTMAFREKHQIVRPDMVHLMMEARKGNLKDDNQPTGVASKNSKSILSEDVIIAQALVFYFGGFETLSAAFSFTAYELALNPDIQDRLFREILQTFKHSNGRITYEELLEMKYLDMVISESLRKWSPGGSIDRRPIKPLNLSLENGKVLTIDEKVICYIPIYALHRDPKYWPEPEKFDPERFNENNKSKIKPFTYLPFGAGPRLCIASRFASLSIKVILFHFLYKFEIVPVDKSAIPLKFSIIFPDSLSAEEYWLGIKPRKTF